MPSLLGLLALLTLGVNPYLDEGRRLYEQVRYREAEPRLRLALEVPTSTREERREASDLLARALAAQGKLQEARRVYSELLARDPHAPVPQAAPKVRSLFEEAKREVYPPDFVRLEFQPAPPGKVRVGVVDPWGRITAARLWPLPREPDAVPLEMRPLPEGGFELELSAAAPGAAPARASVEVLGQEGTPLASAEWQAAAATSLPAARVPGERASSLVLDAPDQATARPAEVRWPVWALVATSAASAVAGALFIVSSERDYAAAGEEGRRAGEIRALEARYREKAVVGRVLLGVSVGAGVGAGALGWASGSE